MSNLIERANRVFASAKRALKQSESFHLDYMDEVITREELEDELFNRNDTDDDFDGL